jgi:hypothetical protein
VIRLRLFSYREQSLEIHEGEKAPDRRLNAEQYHAPFLESGLQHRQGVEKRGVCVAYAPHVDDDFAAAWHGIEKANELFAAAQIAVALKQQASL